MKIQQLVLTVLTLTLSSCSFNEGFPKEVDGRLEPINSEEIKNNVR